MYEKQPKIFIFYGPDGVGKTLSTFKYLANRGGRDKKTLLISNDTYHIGTQDKLQIYSDIVNVDYWHLSINSAIDRQDEFKNYDEIFFDLCMREEDFWSDKIRSISDEKSVIKKILVLNIFMLIHDDLIDNYLSKLGHPDECVITFIDYYSLINEDNQRIIETRINKLSERKTLWISNGQTVPGDFHEYNGSNNIEYYSLNRGRCNMILAGEEQWNRTMIPLIIRKENSYQSSLSLQSPFPHGYSSDILAFGLIEDISDDSLNELGIKLDVFFKEKGAKDIIFHLEFMTANSFSFTDYQRKIELVAKYLPDEIYVKHGWAGRELSLDDNNEHADWGVWLIRVK